MKSVKILCLFLALWMISPAWADSPATDSKKSAGAVRVYRFDNLDIEGHVKTPHLMNFLKRIRNRFRAFRLPQQDYKKKIIETKNGDFL